jgi:hypothetical protein
MSDEYIHQEATEWRCSELGVQLDAEAVIFRKKEIGAKGTPKHAPESSGATCGDCGKGRLGTLATRVTEPYQLRLEVVELISNLWKLQDLMDGEQEADENFPGAMAQ